MPLQPQKSSASLYGTHSVTGDVPFHFWCGICDTIYDAMGVKKKKLS